MWDHKCAICGIELASHAKPWKDSIDIEKIDPYNGVYYVVTMMIFMIKDFISFDGQGRMHISTQITEDSYLKYGLVSTYKMLFGKHGIF